MALPRNGVSSPVDPADHPNDQAAYPTLPLVFPELTDPYDQDPYFPDPYLQL